MGRPARTATSLPSHSRKVKAPARPAAPPFELPLPPNGMAIAAVNEWVRLGPWAEGGGLADSGLATFTMYCNAVGDLQAARDAWAALGCPALLTRTVGPHTGLARHPALASIDTLTKAQLRLAQALGLLKPGGQQVAAAVEDDYADRGDPALDHYFN